MSSTHAGPRTRLRTQDRDDRLTGVLNRHRDVLVRGVAVFRVTAGVVPLLDPTNQGTGALRLLVPATIVLLTLNAALLVLAPRLRLGAGRRSLEFISVDLAVAVVVNLGAALVLPSVPNDPIDDSFWYYLQGTVACAVAVRGVTAAVPLVVVGLPLQLAMARLAGEPLDNAVLSKAALGVLWLLLTLVCAMAVLGVLRVHAESALGDGVAVGAGEEQVRTARSLHDTVLQTLEAIAMRTPADAVEPERRLREVQWAARQQADELRRAIEQPRPAAPGSFAACLAAVAEDAGHLGLRVDLVVEPGLEVEPAVAAVGCDAVREALTNVAKHSRAAEAAVRVTSRPPGVLVVVSDRGGGFDPDVTGPGFGIRQSILGRVTDVGGVAEVTSQPGLGTRVTIWLPA